LFSLDSRFYQRSTPKCNYASTNCWKKKLWKKVRSDTKQVADKHKLLLFLVNQFVLFHLYSSTLLFSVCIFIELMYWHKIDFDFLGFCEYNIMPKFYLFPFASLIIIYGNSHFNWTKSHGIYANNEQMINVPASLFNYWNCENIK
jgi:hypothetical protein